MTRGHKQPRADERVPRRGRGDDGAALLEFALVGVLLFTLLFGIIGFAWLMSFRGSMQQSASEGARAAAAAPRPILTSAPGGLDNSIALGRASVARDNGLKGYGKTCTTAGVTCTTKIYDCSSTTFTDTPAIPDCIQIKISYDNRGHPYPVDIPILDKLAPPTVSVSSTEQLNDR